MVTLMSEGSSEASAISVWYEIVQRRSNDLRAGLDNLPTEIVDGVTPSSGEYWTSEANPDMPSRDEVRRATRKSPGPISLEHVEQLRKALDQLRPTGAPRQIKRRLQGAREVADDLSQDLTTAIESASGKQRTELLAAATIVETLRGGMAEFAAVPAAEVHRQRDAGRAFRLQEPGGKLAAQISPRPFPATLQVVSPTHGQMSVTGLARFFPAHTVHAKDCGTVVDGNECTLTARDHYHVRSVRLSFGRLLKPGSPENSALKGLIKNPTGQGVHHFQQAMRRLTGVTEHRDTRADLPVRPAHLTLASGSSVVQQGDGSRLNVTNHYVIEQSELPVAELFAKDRSLVTDFADAIREPEPESAREKFSRAVLVSAGRVDDLALLDHSTELRGARTSVRGLFGVDSVKRASAVIVGTDNTLKTDMRLDREGLTLDGGLAGLDRIRDLAAQDPPVRRPSPCERLTFDGTEVPAPPARPAPPAPPSPGGFFPW